ncbi:MAG: acetate--CoA ligase family protein [Bacteroidales bacterium]|jgi:acetyltransferase|nr:acetate--CoA ligase family protein [Bacteroidales bacterium]
MINNQLLNPRNIVVIGGSEDVTKPGGKVLKNLIDGKYAGALYVVNPKLDQVQGVRSYRDAGLLPSTDLAIIAIPAVHCPAVVSLLARDKGTRAFIILSAGFSEEGGAGAKLEKEIVEIVDSVGGCLIGPNCIGFLNSNYNGVFTLPIPKLDKAGIDFISGSGATAVFIMESAIPNGLTFSSVYSVGNSAQTGVEEVLEFLDESYIPGVSSRVKILYVESIRKPGKLLRHSSSLIRRGCRIAAIKAGSSDAGRRAASSHTGAMASSDLAVDTLFRKAGIVRCHSRFELTAVASLLCHPLPEGKRIAVITHAGGPAVMLTDALSEAGLEVPKIDGPGASELLKKLFPGSSVANPIDFLATGTAEQLGHIIDACENDFVNIDAMVVIFGSPGLFPVYDVYELLSNRMKSCRKPIYPVLPSVINVRDEISHFLSLGRINFPDEVLLGRSLGRVLNTPGPANTELKGIEINVGKAREIAERQGDGYLSPDDVRGLLDAAGIPRAAEVSVSTAAEAVAAAAEMGYPVAMKVIGPVHKSDAGGVALNISGSNDVEDTFARLMGIVGSTGVLIQKMHRGTELFAGARREAGFGHMVMAGIGGIFIEVLKDFGTALVPVSEDEATGIIRSLRSYPLIRGVRGREGVNEELFRNVIMRLSALLEVVPEIEELDLNPLLGTPGEVVAVDARIRISSRL